MHSLYLFIRVNSTSHKSTILLHTDLLSPAFTVNLHSLDVVWQKTFLLAPCGSKHIFLTQLSPCNQASCRMMSAVLTWQARLRWKERPVETCLSWSWGSRDAITPQSEAPTTSSTYRRLFPKKPSTDKTIAATDLNQVWTFIRETKVTG